MAIFNSYFDITRGYVFSSRRYWGSKRIAHQDSFNLHEIVDCSANVVAQGNFMARFKMNK